MATPPFVIPATTDTLSLGLKFAGAGTLRWGRTALYKIMSGYVI